MLLGVIIQPQITFPIFSYHNTLDKTCLMSEVCFILFIFDITISVRIFFLLSPLMMTLPAMHITVVVSMLVGGNVSII